MTYYIKPNTLNFIPEAIATRKKMIIIWLFILFFSCLSSFTSYKSAQIEVVVLIVKVKLVIFLVLLLRSRVILGLIAINKTALSIDSTDEFIIIKTFPVDLYFYEIRSKKLYFEQKLYEIQQRSYPIKSIHYPIKDMLVLTEGKIAAYIISDFFDKELGELLKTGG